MSEDSHEEKSKTLYEANYSITIGNNILRKLLVIAIYINITTLKFSKSDSSWPYCNLSALCADFSDRFLSWSSLYSTLSFLYDEFSLKRKHRLQELGHETNCLKDTANIKIAIAWLTKWRVECGRSHQNFKHSTPTMLSYII